MKKTLWIRKLSCGHERPTNLAFISGIYKRPRKGQGCYCRECCSNVDIISVEKASEEDFKEFTLLTGGNNKK